jgi:hypothetical protein
MEDVMIAESAVGKRSFCGIGRVLFGPESAKALRLGQAKGGADVARRKRLALCPALATSSILQQRTQK